MNCEASPRFYIAPVSLLPAHHRYPAIEWSSAHDMKVVERDDFEKTIWKAFDSLIDRWLFGSSWAGRWSGKPAESAQKYAKQLSVAAKTIGSSTTAKDVIDVLVKQSDVLLKDIESDAVKAVSDTAVFSRSVVSTYSDLLWVWHRISADRWKMSKIPLRTTGRATTDIEVDHLVPVAVFEGLAKAAAAGDDQKYYSLLPPMNSLGNCSLLEKTFNISKSDKELGTFLDDVHEFKTKTLSVKDWTQALGITDALVRPKATTLEKITESITAREKAIKDELNDFIRGTRARVDVP